MVTIFDIVNNILYKTNKKIEEHHLIDAGASQYMLNRFISMYPDPAISRIINQTGNKILFETVYDYYKYLYSIIPKIKYKRVEYIKAPKNDVNKELYMEISKIYHVSSREIEFGLELKI